MDHEVPYSQAKKLDYEAKMRTLEQKATEEHKRRKEANAAYAERRTKELVAEYKKEMAKEKALQKDAESKKCFYVAREPEFYVVVRIRGVNKVSPKVKKILQLMRLKKPNHAVFVRNNGPMKAMLQRVRAYVAFGFADIRLLRTLVYKRGMAKVCNARTNLTSEAIEDHFLGKIKCVEELIYQIYKGTDLFKKACNFLWPFRLCPPRKGFGHRKAVDVVQGGSTGCHYDKIGELIYRMIE